MTSHDETKDDWNDLPVGFAASILLSLLGVLASVAMLGKETGQMLLRGSSAVSQAGMVLIVELEDVSVPS